MLGHIRVISDQRREVSNTYLVIFCHIWDNYQGWKEKKKQTLSIRSGKLAILLLLDMRAEERRKNEEDGEQESDLILWFMWAAKMKTNHGFLN